MRKTKNWKLKTGNYLSGFTLVEIVVATGIFVVIVALMSGIFSRFTSTQRRDLAEQKLLEELRQTFELFNREARTAYGATFALTDGTGQSVVFRNQNGLCVNFQWRDGALARAERPVSGDTCSQDDFTGAIYDTLNSSKIIVEALRFDVTASPVADGALARQATITIMLRAAASNPTVAPLAVQSSVTSRQVIPFPGE